MLWSTMTANAPSSVRMGIAAQRARLSKSTMWSLGRLAALPIAKTINRSAKPIICSRERRIQARQGSPRPVARRVPPLPKRWREACGRKVKQRGTTGPGRPKARRASTAPVPSFPPSGAARETSGARRGERGHQRPELPPLTSPPGGESPAGGRAISLPCLVRAYDGHGSLQGQPRTRFR